MSRGTTLRSFLTPLGDSSNAKVMLGNVMVSRVVLLCMLIVVMGGCWVIEQPGSSIMAEHPRFRWMCRKLKAAKLR
ncbi:unnamed protein product [Polarella glacialis]|uniref:Uncharacterized protein n=1 Tax=Polarella glacialis TaxID=89957 RepID=A0A813KCE2_POLGL|nr:unnamed protein product [Polarella glacialis]